MCDLASFPKIWSHMYGLQYILPLMHAFSWT